MPPTIKAFGLVVVAILSLYTHTASANVHRFQPGDEVRLALREDADVAFVGPVSATGTVAIPYLGEFILAGKTATEATTALQTALCKDLYETAHISVVLVRRAPGQVYVYGAVKQPGFIGLPDLGELTVMQVVSRVGGLTSWADADNSYLLRKRPNGSRERITVELTKLFNLLPDADTGDPMQLQDGDVLCVPGKVATGTEFISNDPIQVFVVGEVVTPGIVTFEPGEQATLIRAIFKAGGFSKFAKAHNVRLIKNADSPEEREEMIVDADGILEEGRIDQDVSLDPGAMIIVPQKMLNF